MDLILATVGVCLDACRLQEVKKEGPGRHLEAKVFFSSISGSAPRCSEGFSLQRALCFHLDDQWPRISTFGSMLERFGEPKLNYPHFGVASAGLEACCRLLESRIPWDPPGSRLSALGRVTSQFRGHTPPSRLLQETTGDTIQDTRYRIQDTAYTYKDTGVERPVALVFPVQLSLPGLSKPQLLLEYGSWGLQEGS